MDDPGPGSDLFIMGPIQHDERLIDAGLECWCEKCERIALLEDRIGEALSCLDEDCGCKRYLADDRAELAELKSEQA